MNDATYIRIREMIRVCYMLDLYCQRTASGAQTRLWDRRMNRGDIFSMKED